MRTISISSRMRWIGLRNGTPCQPSTTCGPLAPRPSTKRPCDIDASVIAVIARLAGVRATACMMPAPSLMRDVFAARYASGVAASCPHDSADHAKSTPRRSASTANVESSSQSSLPVIPKPMAVFIAGLLSSVAGRRGTIKPRPAGMSTVAGWTTSGSWIAAAPGCPAAKARPKRLWPRSQPR